MERSWGLLEPRRCEHRRVGDFDQVGASEAVEAGAQASSVGAELAELDPIAFAHVGGQPKGPAHPVGAVAGRPEQREIREPFSRIGFAEADAARRKAEPKGAGIAEIAVDSIIDVERVAAPQLHHDRPASRYERPPGLCPQPYTGRQRGAASLDRRDVVGERRGRHVWVTHRESAADIDDVDRNTAIRDRLAGQRHCTRIGIRLEALRADMKGDAETGSVRAGRTQQPGRLVERGAELVGQIVDRAAHGQGQAHEQTQHGRVANEPDRYRFLQDLRQFVRAVEREIGHAMDVEGVADCRP
jgi:hypothetical protein